MTLQRTKFMLDEERIPRAWYNIAADLPVAPPPVLHPGTGQPVGPDDLAPLFPMALIGQEVSTERELEIPEPIRQAYALYRPSPLYRAHRLESLLQTPAHIYYKYEGVSPAGSHKPNTAIAQAFFNKQEGVRRLATETGAGQWGSALAFAGALFGTGYMFPLIKGTELLVGLLLVTNLFVPLALVLIAPVLVNIVAFHVFLMPDGTGIALVFVAFELYLAWHHRRAYRALFTPVTRG
jgi:hypothetical protein